MVSTRSTTVVVVLRYYVSISPNGSTLLVRAAYNNIPLQYLVKSNAVADDQSDRQFHPINFISCLVLFEYTTNMRINHSDKFLFSLLLVGLCFGGCLAKDNEGVCLECVTV